MKSLSNFWKYFFIAVIFWFIVDYTTAFNPDIQSWLSFMPTIFIFYFGYPLAFAYMLYKAKFDSKKIFVAMLVGIFIVEIVFTNNALLYTFPIMLIMIPIGLGIYGFITYVPKWIVENSLKDHKKMTILLTIVWLVVAILGFVTKSRELTQV